MIIDCRRGGLHGVEYASYTQEKVGSLPGAASGGYDLLYRLTMHVSDPLSTSTVPPAALPARVQASTMGHTLSS